MDLGTRAEEGRWNDAPGGPLGRGHGSLIRLAVWSIVCQSKHGDWAFPFARCCASS